VVFEDEPGPLPLGVFFSCGQRGLFPRAMADSSRSRARRPGRWSDHPSALSTRQTWPGVLDRIARRWWQNLPVAEWIHQNGENVSVDLFVRLDGLTKARRGQFIAIALATDGRIGDNARIPNFVKRARESGVMVFDLSTEILKAPPGQLQHLFLPGGHYSPALNRSVAEHIAAVLRKEGFDLLRAVPTPIRETCATPMGRGFYGVIGSILTAPMSLAE
jgi:hypothetical protein